MRLSAVLPVTNNPQLLKFSPTIPHLPKHHALAGHVYLHISHPNLPRELRDGLYLDTRSRNLCAWYTSIASSGRVQLSFSSQTKKTPLLYLQLLSSLSSNHCPSHTPNKQQPSPSLVELTHLELFLRPTGPHLASIRV